MTNRLLVTFDTEDFVNFRSMRALHSILMLLNEHDLQSLFFVTGHFAEKLHSFPEIIDMLKDHEIGFHSSSHSVRPNIFEYTDLQSYREAYLVSLKRETSHIDPFTGSIDGKGGIELLRKMFPKKRIEAFRAPGFSWSPPHLEALETLGIKYDFSTILSRIPAHYKKTTFYPTPALVDWKGTFSFYRELLYSTMTNEVTVLDFHPQFIVNKSDWDLFFPNPAPERSAMVTKYLLLKLRTLLKVIGLMRKHGLIETIPRLEESRRKLNPLGIDIDCVFRAMIQWPITRFNYKPRYLLYHLRHFLGISRQDEDEAAMLGVKI